MHASKGATPFDRGMNCKLEMGRNEISMSTEFEQNARLTACEVAYVGKRS